MQELRKRLRKVSSRPLSALSQAARTVTASVLAGRYTASAALGPRGLVKPPKLSGRGLDEDSEDEEMAFAASCRSEPSGEESTEEELPF